MPAKRLLLGLLLAAVCWPVAGRAAEAPQDVVAVLSAGSGPYQAAFESFAKSFGQQVDSYRLPEDKPVVARQTRVVVAFGGEAALQPYPEHATVIVCLAPGLPTRSRSGPIVTVAMKPSPEVLLGRLRALQPGLKRLAVLWNSAETKSYLKDLQRAGAALGMDVVAVRVSDPGGVPDALRALPGKADALWLAPDPSLITPDTFQTIKQFSWDSALPFYAPTIGLVSAGAAAAVAVSVQEAGRRAAELARQALSGARLPDTVYPANAELAVNPESAAKAGLKIAPEALAGADKVIR
jgi:putative ABC transport system substrate-binding protein